MDLPVNRTFGNLSWYSLDKDGDEVAVTVSEAHGQPPIRIAMSWTDAVRFANDVLTVALNGEPVLDQP